MVPERDDAPAPPETAAAGSASRPEEAEATPGVSGAASEAVPEAPASPPGEAPAEALAEETSGAAPGLSADELRASVEALLYAAPEPLSMRDLRKAIPEAAPEAIRRALAELVELYEAPGRGLRIVEVAGGYQIATRPELHERVGRLVDPKRPPRLSIQALETLAAIAYRQPITIPEIMELRGVRSAGVVRTLLEKKLVKIVGRKEVVGRPLLYGTTKEFLLRFGLRDLSELPRLEDMAEVFGDEITGPMEEAAAGVEAVAPGDGGPPGPADGAGTAEPGSDGP